MRPTLFADVDNAMRIAQEEIFGPVLVVIPYEDEDDAVRIANDSQYGLGGGVWTADPEHGLEVARRIRTGTCHRERRRPGFDGPFGGYKASGIGREFGPSAWPSTSSTRRSRSERRSRPGTGRTGREVAGGLQQAGHRHARESNEMTGGLHISGSTGTPEGGR